MMSTDSSLLDRCVYDDSDGMTTWTRDGYMAWKARDRNVLVLISTGRDWN